MADAPSESPRPVLLLIGCIALLVIGGAFYLGYYAMTAPTTYDHPAVATAPAKPAPPAMTAPAQPPHT